MAITVVSGDTNTFRASAYGRPDVMTMQWCEQREQQQFQNVDPLVRQQFLDQRGTVFGELDYTGILQLSKAMSNQMDTTWMRNVIQTLNTVEQLQVAPPVMINWIMANPVAREMYHRQEIAGYDEYYTDPEPGKNGEDHYYYRRAVNGLFLEDSDGELVANEWLEDLWDPADSLDIVDQRSIQATWQTLVTALRNRGSDPTSRWNAQL